METLPFVWEVRKDGHPSYVVPTIHLHDPALAAAAQPYVDMVRKVFVEKLPGFAYGPEHFLLPDGGTIDDVLAPDEVTKVLDFYRVQYGPIFTDRQLASKLAEVQRTKPWYSKLEVDNLPHHQDFFEYLAWQKQANAIEAKYPGLKGMEPRKVKMPKKKPKKPSAEYKAKVKWKRLKKSIAKYEAPREDVMQPDRFDHAIKKYTLAQGKELIALDEPDEYTAVYDSIPVDVVQRLLVRGIENYGEEVAVDLAPLVQAYKAGDEEAIVQLLVTENADDELWLRTQRDGRTDMWYPKTLPDFEEGGIFVGVGASHILGDTGYIKRLEQDGFMTMRL